MKKVEWRPPSAAIKAMGRLGYALRRHRKCDSKDIGLLWSAACAPRRQHYTVKESRTEYIVVQVPILRQELHQEAAGHQETVGTGLYGSGCTAGDGGWDCSGAGSGGTEEQCHNFPIDLTF